jgi:hypothetical protein
MSDAFFEKPILNSPYEVLRRHWQLENGQPTGVIAPHRRRAEFITPIPKTRKQTARQQGDLLDESLGLSSIGIYTQRNPVKSWRNATKFTDEWLNNRYRKRVMNHSNSTNALSAGTRALPDGVQAFAHTQAMWRFLSNPRVTPRTLAQPLRETARKTVAQQSGDWVLCARLVAGELRKSLSEK